VKLHVRARERAIGARENAALVDADRHRPVRRNAYCRPIATFRHGERKMSFVVIGLRAAEHHRACK
jgi:hypothetical protein